MECRTAFILMIKGMALKACISKNRTEVHQSGIVSAEVKEL